MSCAKSFRVTLQNSLRSSDSSWSYIVPNLPPKSETDEHGLIKSIRLLSNPTKQAVELRFENAPQARVLSTDPLHLILIITFANFNLQIPAIGPKNRTQTAPGEDTADYIARLLKTGVTINGLEYHFYGHSNSQLGNSRSCYMFAAPKRAIESKIDAMGDMSKFRSVAKKAKRIALLFTDAETVMKLKSNRVEDINDVKHDDYIFTDGCGLIAASLATQIAKQKHIVHRNIRYTPSVYQIRYRGYKGVLTLSPNLTSGKVAQFRTSMRKLDDVNDDSFCVIDHSKPYTIGYLNDDVVLLLHTLGVTTETLLRKQSEFFNFLEAVSNGDIHATFQFLSFIDRVDLGEKLLLEGIGAVLDIARKKVQHEYSRMSTRSKDQRCRIMIKDSRLLFGVCDPSAAANTVPKLNAGTCFVRITAFGDGQARTIVDTEVLVTRNPCLHPGDLQKFRAVDVPEFSHLVDCIVFPTVGKRPSADLMSGGDLDGDKFIVVWDPDVIPRRISEPALYPAPIEKKMYTDMSGDGRANYFARYNNRPVSRIKVLHTKWARLRGAMSPECQQLNRLHSLALDGFDTCIPTSLEDPPEILGQQQPFILDILHVAAEERIKRVKPRQIAVMDLPVDAMSLLLSRDSIAIHEFDLIQVTLRWCRHNDENLLDYAQFFNFNALTDEQQKWLLGELAPMRSAPSMVRNGLLQSHILQSQELHRFGLDHHGLHWKSVFDSSVDRMGRFMTTFCRSMELFHKKLVVFQPNERLTLAVYIPTQVPRANETLVGVNVRVFALPQSKGADSSMYRVQPTTIKYRLYCDEKSFSLYDDKRGNTFIYLTRGSMDKSTFSHLMSRGDRRRQKQVTIDESINFDCRASIALNKISRDIQEHVGRILREGVIAAEIYVISNRDVESMHVLDQWLHHVDTDEILPLFENSYKEYTTDKVSCADGDGLQSSGLVAHIARNKDVSRLSTIETLEDVQKLLDILQTSNDNLFLVVVYENLLSLDANGKEFQSARSENQVERCNSDLPLLLLKFLQVSPYLTSIFFQSTTWFRNKARLGIFLNSLGPILLKQLVLTANSSQHTIRQHFLAILQGLEELSLQIFVELVELISLTTSDHDVAIELLFGCLEPESTRLLVGSTIELRQFTKYLFGVALNHIDEFSKSKAFTTSPTDFKLETTDSEGYQMVQMVIRIDSPEQVQVGDHIQMRPSNPPKNAPLWPMTTVDAVVLRFSSGSATIRCLHLLPDYAERCRWDLIHCTSFVTSKAMFDAVLTFFSQKSDCCSLYSLLVESTLCKTTDPVLNSPLEICPTLNSSQKVAVEAALRHPCTFITGPYGTGKSVITAIIAEQMLYCFDNTRILVVASAHATVDALMKRFLLRWDANKRKPAPLRVSTRIHKVSDELWEHTCDASNPSDRDSQRRIQEAQLVFSTCAGAGLGLMRPERFGVVLIANASQQPIPESLIPLTKGCRRVVLIGDHAEPRVAIHKLAAIADFDISLFEDRYLRSVPGITKVKLDTQYKTASDVCAFLSREFYDNAIHPSVRTPIPPCEFPWPPDKRMAFVQCSTPEDLGHASKSNRGQVNLCARVSSLLTGDFAILTPYARQRDLITKTIPGANMRGPADIIIFVTVRCNPHRDIGIDYRYLNVLSQARTGVIVIGDKATLVAWTGLLDACEEVLLG